MYGQDFFGFVSGFGAQVVRLLDVPFDTTELKVVSSSSDYSVAISDASSTSYAKESIYSPLDVNSINLQGFQTVLLFMALEKDIRSYTNVLKMVCLSKWMFSIRIVGKYLCLIIRKDKPYRCGLVELATK